jgi:hypothetical protein
MQRVSKSTVNKSITVDFFFLWIKAKNNDFEQQKYLQENLFQQKK